MTGGTGCSGGTDSRSTPGSAATATRGTTTCSRPTRWTKTRGKQAIPHDAPDDPPRRRANGRRGHGPFDTDRPPMAGVVGRESGEVRLEVIESAGARELDDVIADAGPGETTVDSDGGNGDNRVGKRPGRVHRTVDRSGPRWTGAIDGDGDGVREIRRTPQEGLWTGLGHSLRPFRGVSKWSLA